ncbi:LysR family transcriptional regulator [Nocardioides daphniae]|uniref:LysR family transcriptional regulator n=1 Tax=Nocardioides daphniae TaxID=402297 RepID=UPI001930F19B|nr:LysR family transcriptional regulator [Nocardioides daphniae]
MARAEGVPAFTMNQLAAFVAVAEAGTISGAAERLHISPSALSASVTELERHLQTQLLHRRKAKGVSLTASGELVLPRARYLLHQAPSWRPTPAVTSAASRVWSAWAATPRWRRPCCRSWSPPSRSATPRPASRCTS